jgi:beta-glucanase (GH16 family)
VGIRLGKPELLAASNLRLLLGVALIAIALATLAGCGFNSSANAVQGLVALRGTVYAARQPVSGSSVQLYAAGINGVGSTAQPLLSSPVRSDSDGSFSIPASYFCPSASSQLYVVARGGSPGLPSGDNAALALTAMLGSCDSLPSTPVQVNEVTTVGSVWPIAAYMKSPSEIGSAPNDSGFLAAVSSVKQFINFANGSSPGTATATSYFNQSSKLYSLADVLARCIDSAGGSAGDGSPCGTLFSLATPSGAGLPTDTMTAAMRIAQNPSENVTGIYEQVAAPSFFQPVLTAAPPDWTLQLSHPVAAPSISLGSGTYVGNQEVTISDATAGSTIHYTTDGTVPTTSSPVYSGALSIAVSSTIEAIAVMGASQSSVSSSTLTITATHPPTQLAFLQQPTNALTQATISPAVTVAAEDANGNVVSSATNPIELSLSGGATGLGGTLSVTPQNGIATFSNLTVSTAGIGYTMSARSPGLTSATSTRFTISQSSTVSTTISVALTPGSVTLTPLQTQTFTATVSNTSNTAVTWSLSPAVGTISAAGLYTAPAAVPSSATVIITAASVSDPTKSASAGVTIVPPQAAGYNLVWEDTFSTLSLCTTSMPGCNWYNPGLLTNPGVGVVTDPSGTNVNLEWAIGQIDNTYTNITTAAPSGGYYHAWTFGYFEVSMKFNPTTGSWPALWMLSTSTIGASPATISGGELDIFEWQSQIPTMFNGTAHVWANGVVTASSSNNERVVPEGTNFANYNTYGVLWTPTAISWYLNNVLMETVSTTSTPYNTVYDGAVPMFLVLSQQAGCNWASSYTTPCSGQVSPLNMQVQWVHVYQAPATH